MATLEEWIEESRDDLRQHGSLAMAVREWQLTDEDPDYLLSESRLAVFDGWLRSSLLRMNTQEQRFLAASRAQLAERQASESERLEHEARSRRRLLGAIAALAAALGVAALFLFGVFGPSEAPVVHFFGDLELPGVSAQVASGLDRADRELDMTLVYSRRVAGDAEGQLRLLAETDPEIIIVDSFGLGDGSIFLDYPDIEFGLIDDTRPDVTNAANVTTGNFANEEGGFLAGAAAALQTETRVVGFLGANQGPFVQEWQAGFESGVRAVDPDITVLVTYIDQFDEIPFDLSWVRPDIGRARAAAMYERDADVLFAAAGFSGVFEAAVEQSSITGRHLWVIGADSDQWFDVPAAQRPHVLTSIVKRWDGGALMLAEQLISDDRSQQQINLGIANGGFSYATSGDNLGPEMVQALDGYIEEITDQGIEIPTRPTVTPLLLSPDGDDIDESQPATQDPPLGAAGLVNGELLEAGTYEFDALGTPLTLTSQGNVITVETHLGFATFGHPDTIRLGDRTVTFIRPQLLTDPAQPQAAAEAQVWWPLDDIEGWLDNLIDGVVTNKPEMTEIGGWPAVYFEAEIRDDDVCGSFGFCVAFVGTQRFDNGNILGYSFLPGFHNRVWWVDQGDQPPLMIVAATPSDDRSFQATADELLATLIVGDPQPHPVGDLLPGPD